MDAYAVGLVPAKPLMSELGARSRYQLWERR